MYEITCPQLVFTIIYFIKTILFCLDAIMNTLMACSNCGIQELDLLRCGQCKSEFYCSKVCQKQHWKKGHKETCMAIICLGEQSIIDKIPYIAKLVSIFFFSFFHQNHMNEFTFIEKIYDNGSNGFFSNSPPFHSHFIPK